MYFTVVDLEKAFDCVPRNELWCALRGVGKGVANALGAEYVA